MCYNCGNLHICNGLRVIHTILRGVFDNYVAILIGNHKINNYKYGNRLHSEWFRVMYCNGLGIWNYAILSLDTLISLLFAKSNKDVVQSIASNINILIEKSTYL
jgi:hypothetical protein